MYFPPVMYFGFGGGGQDRSFHTQKGMIRLQTAAVWSEAAHSIYGEQLKEAWKQYTRKTSSK